MSTLRRTIAGGDFTGDRTDHRVKLPVLKATPGDELAVRVLGGFALSRAGLTVPAAQVGSRKARNLLALLAVDAGHLSVDTIAAAVWGDDLPRDPVANIATLVSRLRATFGPHLITGDRSGYRLGRRVRVDLAVAATRVTEAESLITDGQPVCALRAARRAMRLLCRGGVLPDLPEARWTEPANIRHSVLLVRARHAAAESALRVGDVNTARTTAEDALATDPFDEVACRMLMRAYRASGEPARALMTYQRLRIALATELGVDPALITRNLHTAILRETAAARAAS